MEFDKLSSALVQRLSTLETAQATGDTALSAAQAAANIAMIAAILSFIGVVITGIIAHRNGFVQARTTQQLKHAEFRQKWIDELRAEMARFTLLTSSPEALTQKRPEVLQSMSMIMMRMDREDQDHDDLMSLMKNTITASGPIDSVAEAHDFGKSSGAFLSMCQSILKREWEVLKEDMHATPWGWPISVIVKFKRKRARIKRVEANKRRRAGEPLVPDREWGLGRLRLIWKAPKIPREGEENT